MHRIRESISAEVRARYREQSDLLAHLLYHRGVEGAEAVSAFLTPSYDQHTHDPLLLKDAKKAAERIVEAIRKNERIAIYSDYDADGIPAGVLMHDLFKKIGYTNFRNYIPDRHDEGFGVHKEALDELALDGVKVVITLDCGIANIEEAKHAKTLDLDLIVTDHHEPHPELPDAFAIVNPKQPGCAYPEKMLCGSGVAYKLAQAVLSVDRFGIPLGWEKWLLDMVGIATVSDMVPLAGENRVLAHYGLSVLRKSRRVGLQQLLKKLRVRQETISEDDVGFSISPRINAASRMGRPHDAFKLLSTTDIAEAGALALHLDTINNERKGTVAAMVKEMKKHLTERDSVREAPVLVLGDPKWRPSLLGLAANNLVELHGKPAFLWGRDGADELKGSCRAPKGTSVVALMERVPAGLLTHFGGHAPAGGFGILAEKVHLLQDALSKAHTELGGGAEREDGFADGLLSTDEVGWRLYDEVQKLAPFGVGNPRPLFIVDRVVPLQVRWFGKNEEHVELLLPRKTGSPLVAIGFFMRAEAERRGVATGAPVTVAVSLEKDQWKSGTPLRLRIVDFTELAPPR